MLHSISWDSALLEKVSYDPDPFIGRSGSYSQHQRVHARPRSFRNPSIWRHSTLRVFQSWKVGVGGSIQNQIADGVFHPSIDPRAHLRVLLADPVVPHIGIGNVTAGQS